jgi:hypothetical protein
MGWIRLNKYEKLTIRTTEGLWSKEVGFITLPGTHSLFSYVVHVNYVPQIKFCLIGKNKFAIELN